MVSVIKRSMAKELISRLNIAINNTASGKSRVIIKGESDCKTMIGMYSNMGNPTKIIVLMNNFLNKPKDFSTALVRVSSSTSNMGIA